MFDKERTKRFPVFLCAAPEITECPSWDGKPDISHQETSGGLSEIVGRAFASFVPFVIFVVKQGYDPTA
jgi:hypothetical protein